MKIYLFVILSFVFSRSFSQVEDHFDDGDFSNSPTWSGNSGDFNVNASRQLQLNAVAAGNSFLSVPVNLNSLDECEWRFYVRLAFSPSTSNYARVYLSSDQQDLLQPLNGYFLQFGEALSNDAIELFRQTGTTFTSLCRGQTGKISSSFAVGIKVIRSSSGLWAISVDYSGGEDYQTEATGSDNFISSASFIGVACAYTSGNINHFYFDDFYAGPEIRDSILPFITNLSVESDSILSINYSEKIDEASNNFWNYAVDNSFGFPASIFPDSVDKKKYYLKFSQKFNSGISYAISFSGMKDLSGNKMMDTLINFEYQPVSSAQLNDVVFSEIYFEPSETSPLPYSEYIEIYNRKDSTLLISDWLVSDGSSDGLISSFRLESHGFVVLYSESDSLDFLSIPNSVPVKSFPTLNNDVGDHLVLKNKNGDLISELKFNNDFYKDNHKDDGGWSIERIDPDFVCANGDNWRASISQMHGTPGNLNSNNGRFVDLISPTVTNIFLSDSNKLKLIFSEKISEGLEDSRNYKIKNSNGNIFNPASISKISDDTIELHFSQQFDLSIYTIQFSASIKDCPGNSIDENQILKFGFPQIAEAGDILINELLFNSFEGGNDFLEIYNTSSKIIDLKNWSITESSFDDSTDVKESALISNVNRLIFPGDYLVLTEDKEKVKLFYLIKNEFAFLNVKSMPDFNSTGGRAIIFDAMGNEMDAMKYSDDMHFPLLAETIGVSLERLSFLESSDKKNNWHSAAATAGFATPGYGNSQLLKVGTSSGGVTIDDEVFSPDNDGYDDVLSIHYYFPQTGSVLSLNVYDYNGLLVRTLLAGETISNEGSISWDGLNNDRFLSPSGIYILLAESFDLDGKNIVSKKVCFLTRR